MKKVFSVVALALVLLLSLAVMVSAEEFTSQEAGFSNIQFDNGYYGFCIDSALSGAAHGDSFQDAGKTSVATNNKTGVDVSQKLKILFTQCFEDIFVSDGNGGYIMDDMKADSSVQNAVWYFTDGTESTYIWGDTKTFVEAVNAYDGPEIPDNDYVRTLDNGDKITFYFTVVEPQNTSQQSFFAYKIQVNQVTEHEHDYSDEWKSDDDNHWHECECGDKKDTAEHKGNEADCVTPSTCEECEKKLADENPDKHTGNTEVKNAKPATEYEDGYTGDTYCSDCDKLLEKGEVIPATHVHDYSDEWKSDDDNHWHECECGDKKDTAEHKGNEADCVTPSTCEECEKKLADENPEKHTGNTELKNAKPATEYEDGYTGDTYCSDCDELLEKGEVIPATHEHDYSDEWKSDDDNHWHECECGDKKDTAEHKGNEADCVTPSTCEECEKKLADENPEKHTGNTELKNAKPATEYDDGYTGDTYCSDCDKFLEKGEVIPATHVHDYSDEWKSDDDNHWHECECGDRKDTAEHKGNEADCVTPSTCEECEKKLADENPDKHTGNTEVKNAKPATEYEDGYTGDTYCSDCDELLEKGEVIPATHVHDYSDEWKSDDDNHWHECECGDKKDIMGHIIVDGTCKTCNSAIKDSDDTDNDTDADTDTDTDIDTDVDTDTDSDETIEMPVTGRTTNVALLVSIMVLSMCAIAATAPRKRKDSIV